MKRITLLVEMRCNNYCVYCGSRAIDKVMIEKRLQLGLTVPSRRPGIEYYTRKALRTVRRAMGIPTPTLPMIKGWPFEVFTLESAVEVLQKARADGVEAVNLQGGEPSIWPPVVGLIAEARRLGFREILMVTNGRRFADPDFARRMMSAGLTHLVLSLLGYDAATHDEITLVPGSYDALVQGIRNCVALRNSGLPVSLTCNVITSGETYFKLPEQVAMLAELGIDAMNLHLVRFEKFGDDPTLRKRLSFPITQIRDPLRDATQEARRRNFPLVTEDIPLCLHPWVSQKAVHGMLERHRSEHRHYEGPLSDFVRQGVRPQTLPPACQRCLLSTPCGYVPPEYVPEGEDEALRSITVETLADSLKDDSMDRIEEISSAIVMLCNADMLRDEQSAALLGEARSAWARLITAITECAESPFIERRLSLEALSEKVEGIFGRGKVVHSETGNGAVESLDALIRSGYRRLVELAMVAGDEIEAIHALHDLLGIHPFLDLRAEGELQMARLPTSDLVRAIGLVDSPSEESGRDLVFGSEFRLTVRGSADDLGVVSVSSLGVALETAAAWTSPCDLLFLVHVAGTLRGAQRLRCQDGRLEIDRGKGWKTQFIGKSTQAPRWEA